jgi:hypothetical protein
MILSPMHVEINSEKFKISFQTTEHYEYYCV